MKNELLNVLMLIKRHFDFDIFMENIYEKKDKKKKKKIEIF